jgi:ribokinase
MSALTHEVTVLGSANMDTTIRVHALPAPGETTLGRQEHQGLGGKGANQAVACARSGARTCFLGAVGNDLHADRLIRALEASGVRVDAVRRCATESGSAIVTLDAQGENSIVVVPGANDDFVHLTEDERGAIERGRVLLAQLEVPLPTVVEAIVSASNSSTLVVLNAAPSRPLPEALLNKVDILVVNEGEASSLSGTKSSAELAGETLLQRAKAVVITLGARGALFVDQRGASLRISAPPTAAVDTTGAGDTFCGVLAGSLASGLQIDDALRRACAAASLATERVGVLPSIPHKDSIERRLAHAEAATRQTPAINSTPASTAAAAADPV